MDEKKLENRFRRKVQKLGGRALKFTVPGKRGMPDRIILLPGGKVWFAELKAPGKRLQPLQEKRAAELRTMGFPVYKIDSDEAIDAFLAEFLAEVSHEI